MGLRDGRTALLLIEFQKQWTEPGLYHRLIARELARRAVVENTVRLVAAARSVGAPIVHAPLIIDQENLTGIFAKATKGKFFTAGTSRCEFTDGVHRDGDWVARGRTSFDAFTNSDLQQVLRHIGVSRLLLCGFTTDQCVTKTFRTALAHDFDAHVVSDCTATFARVVQAHAERKFGSRAVGVDEVIAAATG